MIKESSRHKELKNKIGNLLKVTKGVEVDSICIDNKFIDRNGEKRKPDVFCEYNGKKIVFEIQLSQLSLSYILSRQNFYRENGFYLIWILDSVDFSKKDNLNRDIKYQNRNQNLFYLDEKSDKQLKLICKYKKVWRNKNNFLQEKWYEHSIFLDKLKFDTENFQVFFYNYEQQKNDIKKQIKLFQRLQQEQIEKSKKQQQKQILQTKIEGITDSIKRLKEKAEKHSIFNDSKLLLEEISQLNHNEIEELNKKLNFYHGYPKALNRWISMIENNAISFVEFILQCNQIDININKIDNEKTVFQTILLNENICNKEIFNQRII